MERFRISEVPQFREFFSLVEKIGVHQIHPSPNKKMREAMSIGHFRYLKRRYCITLLKNVHCSTLEIFHQSANHKPNYESGKSERTMSDKYNGFFKDLAIVCP